MNFVNGIPVDGHQLVDSVYEFNNIGQTTPPGADYNADRTGFYIGMMLEEMAETLEAVMFGAVDKGQEAGLRSYVFAMKDLGKSFKEGGCHGAVLRADRTELLDGCIDVSVVTLGAMMYQTPRFREAIGAVLRANAEKCPGGVATHDANGKIVKPAGWTKPDLSTFVNTHGQE